MMDRRWQLVLDCHDCHKPPFSKGTFVQFRKVLINKGLDQRLVERTVEIAKKIGHWQGDRARYLGLRKNLFDLRRVAVVHNLHVIARIKQSAVDLQAVC